MASRAWKIGLFSLLAAAAIDVAPARAADCGDSAAGFSEWLNSFKKVAVGNGVSQQVVDFGVKRGYVRHLRGRA